MVNVDWLIQTNYLKKSILKFSDLVKYKTCIMMFKLFTNDCPKHLQLRFTIYENPHNRVTWGKKPPWGKKPLFCIKGNRHKPDLKIRFWCVYIP